MGKISMFTLGCSTQFEIIHIDSTFLIHFYGTKATKPERCHAIIQHTTHYCISWEWGWRLQGGESKQGRERETEGKNQVVYTRLIYSSLRGRWTIHARQQLLHIILRLLPYSQWMNRDRCCITNNVSVDLHVAWGMCTQQTRGSHYCAAVSAKQHPAF